jgi:hypothetical protein
MSTDHFPDATKKVPAVGALLDPGVGRLVPERTTACTHCGSVACANGGGAMTGYWVIHPGCDDAKAEKERA